MDAVVPWVSVPRFVVVVVFVAFLAAAGSAALLAAPMTVQVSASTSNGPAHSFRCGQAMDLTHSDFDSEGSDDGKCLPMARRRFAFALAAGGLGLTALAGLTFLGALTVNRKVDAATT
jgi:hypothetical protein